MKKTIALLLCLLLALSCAGCKGNESAQTNDPAPAVAEPEQSSVPEEPEEPETPEEPAETPAEEPDPPEESASTDEPVSENAPETVVSNQDCFDEAYCFRPEADGVYSFTAVTSEEFSGWESGYEGGLITWEVYALEEAFDDAWRFLGQAYQPIINDLDGTIRVGLKAGQYVYCVCSYNGFTAGEPAADDSGTLTISKTSVSLLPDVSNGYVMPVSVGTSASADLDGDGTLETICYSVSPAYAEDELWYDAQPESLTVNGTDLLDTEGENPFESYGIWLENPDTGKYYIVDLDENDDKLELAICDWGSNDWMTTCLFQYEDGALTYLGHITDLPESESTAFHGDGTVSAHARFDVMQTWGGVVTYELRDGKVERKTGEFVQPSLYDEREITLIAPLTVYASPDRADQSLTLEPSDEPLSFPLTDTEHWVLVCCADGTEGWAYFENGWMVENNGTFVEDTEVFGNLLFAG